MRKIQQHGCDWYTFGAQGGIVQPPYVLRWRNRWWRTRPLSCAPAGSPENMSELVRLALDKLGRMPGGARRCRDYLNRTGKSFGDLPLFDDAQAKQLLEGTAEPERIYTQEQMERAVAEAELRGVHAVAKLLCVRCRRGEPISLVNDWCSHPDGPCTAWRIHLHAPFEEK